MSRQTVLRWSVAGAAFVAIGIASMRFGHGVGLALLVAALLVVFALDLADKRREPRPRRPASPNDGDPSPRARPDEHGDQRVGPPTSFDASRDRGRP